MTDYESSTNGKHAHHDNGGAVGDWKVLSFRPPLRGAMACNQDDVLGKVALPNP